MKIGDIFDALAGLAPIDLAAPWDNPGLLLGDMQAECSGVMVALDLSASVIEQAQKAGCNLILTHHPFIFTPQPHILAGSYEGDMALALARAGMNAIACHTNWDNAPGGINYALAEALDLRNITPWLSPDEGAEILLLTGELAEPLSAAELCRTAARALGLPVIRAAGLDPEKQYRKLAVCGGAGMDLWRAAAAAGCDALLSADGKHHEGLQAAHAGFAVLDGTHFATEVIGIRRLGRLLAERLPGLAVCYAEEADSWQYYEAQ